MQVAGKKDCPSWAAWPNEPRLVDAAKAAFSSFSGISPEDKASVFNSKSIIRSVKDNDSSFSHIVDENASLYEQMGGEPKMKIFVDYFMDGIMADELVACYH